MTRLQDMGAVLTLFLGAVAVCAAQDNATARWYTPSQVEQGARLYAQHCIACHGPEGRGTADWKTLDADGKYPPPPVNGTAHAWHHPLPVLRRTVREGGVRLGGKMPGFADSLNDAEVDAVIAWVQSLWPEGIYAQWSARNRESGGAAAAPATPQAVRDTEGLATLRAWLPDATIGPPQPTPLPGLRRVEVQGDYLYLTRDGRYALLGDLVDLRTRTNLTQTAKAEERRTRLAGVPASDMVEFPALGTVRAEITVFTDTSCPFCKRLHREVPALQAAGVTVRYLAFPRGGTKGPGYAELRAVWCAKDRPTAMDIAKGVRAGELGPGDCAAAGAVDRGYRLGIEFGVSGTPSILLPDGRLIPGYRSAKDILALLRLPSS